MRRLFLNSISDRILIALHSDPRVAVLQEFLKHDAQIYVLAGAIRDALASEYHGADQLGPRDIDIAVSNVSREFFTSLAAAHGARNRHGGYVLAGHTRPTWDLWRLEDSIGLRKTNTPCSLENVLRTFNLSCNAIALDIRTAMFVDAGAIDAVRKNRLSFVRNAIAHSKSTFAAKALLSQLRFAYTMDFALHNFVAEHLDYTALLHESLETFPGLAVLGVQDS
jgi:hypothetical protein